MAVASRTASDVIDQAIRENRFSERLCYALIIVFVSLGAAVIITGICYKAWELAGAGAVPAALFWPAMNHARGIRRENMMIRLLEVPLMTARTAESAAEAIRNAFTDAYAAKRR
jgi:hypothetical protein